MTDDSLPLHGLLVVDLTRVLAGPYCTRLLSDLGARVIKIERPIEGDEMRHNPHQIEPGRDDQSTYFARVNAGKESVAVDLSRPDGRDVVLGLAGHADVFIENFAPGVAGKLGLDYAAVAAVKRDIVYCSISGFGQTGPWRERPAFAHIINAASGMMALEQGDEAAPRASNLQAADVLAAAHAMGAIMAALWRRARTGQGAHLDVSMLEALVGADSVTYASVLNGGEEHGNPRPGMIVHKIGDRYMAMQIVGAPRLWQRLLGTHEAAGAGRGPALHHRAHAPAPLARAARTSSPAGSTRSPARTRRSRCSARRASPARRCCGRPRSSPPSTSPRAASSRCSPTRPCPRCA